MSVKIYSSRECHRCKKLAAFLERNGFHVDFLLIEDPENETDLIMHNIMAVPAIVGKTSILKLKDIFSDVANDVIDEEHVLSFVKGM